MTGPGGTSNLLTLKVAVENATASGAAAVKAELAGMTVAAEQAGVKSAAGLSQIDRAFASTQAAAKATSVATRTELAALGAAAGRAGAEAGGKFASGWNESLKALTKPMVATLGVFALADFLKESVGAAKTQALEMRRVTQAFGEAGAEVKEWAETTAKAFGYTAAAAGKAASDYGSFLQGQGVGQAESADMSKRLTQLTADMAKFRGVDRDSVQDAITNALAGRGMALRKLGVDLSQASIAAFAYDHGLAKVGETLNNTQRAEAAYGLIIEKTSNQQGAYAKSADSLGSAQQQLGNAIDELKVKVGTGLTPVLKAAAVFMRDGLMPVLDIAGSALGLVGKAIGSLPSGVLTAGGAFLAFKALRAEKLFSALAVQTGFLSTALSGAGGLTGAFGKVSGAASGFFSFLSTGPGMLGMVGIASMIAAVTSEIDRADKIARQGADGVKSLAAQYVELGVGADGAGRKIDEATRKIAFQNIQNLDDGALVKWAKKNGITMAQLTDAYLDMPGSDEVRKKIKAWGDKLDGGSGTDATRTVAKWSGLAPGVAEFADKAQSAADATKKFLGANGEAVSSAQDVADATKGVSDAVADQDTKLRDLADTWNSLDDQITNVITDLDKLAGRNPTFDQAMAGMYQSADDMAAKFKLGQAGATRLNPNVLDPSGRANLQYSAGRDLQTSVLAGRDSTVKAAQAAADRILAEGGTAEAAKQAASGVANQGFGLIEKNLTMLLGTKALADQVLKAYGMFPDRIVTDVVLNAAAAVAKGKDLISVQDQIAGGGSGGGAGQAGSAAGPVGAAVKAATTPPAFSQSTYDSQVPHGIGVNTSTSGSSTFNSQVPAGVGAFGKIPADVLRWQGLVDKVLAAKGMPTNLDYFLLNQMSHESSGNPTAINLTDSNAKKGTPSKGLLQMIDPTFKSYADPGFDGDIYDPESQIRAATNYTIKKYGSLPWLADNNFGPYDNGGWLKPHGVAVSFLDKPEAVLAPDQWETAKAALQQNRGGGRGVVIQSGAFPITIGGGGSLPSGSDLDGFRENIRRIFTEEQERSWHR